MFDEDINLEDIPVMERLKHKVKLHKTVSPLWKEISAEKEAYPRGYQKFITKTLMKDVKKGIKIINKKNPIFIEMPTLTSVGNGAIKRVPDGVTDLSELPTEISLPNNSYLEDKR